MAARLQRILFLPAVAAALLLFSWILIRSHHIVHLTLVAAFAAALVAARARPSSTAAPVERVRSFAAAALRPFPVAVIAALALALRLLWSQHFDPRLVSDFREFHDMARQFAAGDTSVLGPAKSPITVAFYGILYKLPLRPLVTAQVANALLGAAQAVLLYAIARRAFNSRAAGRLAGLAAALFPSAVMSGALPASEPLFVTLLLLVVWQLLRLTDGAAGMTARRIALLAALAGAQAALLHLTRNSGAVYAAWALVVCLVWARAGAARSAALAGSFLAAAALFLLPQMVHNARTYGTPSIQSSKYAGLNFLCGTNRESSGRYNGRDAAFIRNRYGDERWNEAMAAARRRALRRIAEDVPGFFAFALTEKFDVMWCDDTWAAMIHPTCMWRNTRVLWRDISNGYYFALMALAAAGLCLAAARGAGAAAVAMAGGILAATALLHVFIEVQPRYHVVLTCLLPLYTAPLVSPDAVSRSRSPAPASR